jgi:nucleotide-binding universal stress UspA family protein
VIQNIKNVLIGLTKEFGSDEASSALGYGLSLAQQADAHATVEAASVKLALHSAWVTRVAAQLVQAENRRLRALAEAAARSAQTDAAAAGVLCSTRSPHLSYHKLLTSFTAQARVNDLTIVDAEPEVLNLDRGLIEALLIESGRPLLIVPSDHHTFQCRRILLAWDGSAKAARATHDALPFLRASEAVEIITVTGEKDLLGTTEGAEIASHLSRHGVPVTVNAVRAQSGDVAQTLREAVELAGTDMIVMGGYVHSRLREFVLGGVTQALMRSSPVPLFMSY